MKHDLKIAVRDLVQHTLRSGDLVFEFLGATRSMDAIRAHQRIQNSRPQTYQAELSISHSIETSAFVLTVSGRIDGVFTESDRTVIEEIKTTTRDLETATLSKNPLHWGQAKIYAYMYACQHGLNEIDIQLVYCQIERSEIREVRQCVTLSELEAFFYDLVRQYLQWATLLADWSRQRDESIRSLEFPFSIYRPGQRRMAVEVYRTIQNDGQLLVQAATGIGKTMAVIFPAIKAIGASISSKIFYLTARTTGRIVAEQALDELRAKGLEIKSLTLTAKEKICFHPDSACHPDECDYAHGHYDRIHDALRCIFQKDAFTRNAILETADACRVCPFEFSLELSLWADVIICDYNYAFDPRVFLRRFFQEENGNYTFLIDEAHNLVDRSREMFSAEIFKQPVLDLRRAVKDELPQIYKILGRINAWLLKASKKCDESQPTRAEKEPPAEFFPVLRQFLHLAENWLAMNLKTAYREALLEFYFSLSGFLKVADQYDQSYATCYRKIQRDFNVKLFCIDPSQHLKTALKRCRAAIFFSATMTPLTYFTTILGCGDRADHLILPSPFPRENLAIFITDRVSTLYRHRCHTKAQVLGMILAFVNQCTGNYLLFFPSYEYMRMVYELFLVENPDTETIIQTPGMTESERDAFLGRFDRQNPQTLIGFAVLGGIFGEGIDLVGKRLCGAVIVGVGLPAISLENDLVRNYFDQNRNSGFEFAYLYPGINRVLQAAGRVIRTENDRGVVLLIDRRYATSRYKSILPDHWQPIRIVNTQRFAQDLKMFWNRKESLPITETA